MYKTNAQLHNFAIEISAMNQGLQKSANGDRISGHYLNPVKEQLNLCHLFFYCNFVAIKCLSIRSF